MWLRSLAPTLRIPLINADRMFLSILPEASEGGHLARWAAELRDTDQQWMRVAQLGVQAFVGHAMDAKIPFAMETVFSHWRETPDGRIESKIDLIRDMQAAGYFVLLLFVGLSNAELSILRVRTRVFSGGHDVEEAALRSRFPRTQKAISAAIPVADAAILADNSRAEDQAFTVCGVRLGTRSLYDIRDAESVPPAISAWIDQVIPREMTPAPASSSL